MGDCWATIDMGRNVGAVPVFFLGGGELGFHLTQYGLGQGLPRTKPFDHNRHGPKRGRLLWPLLGEVCPHLTQCGLGGGLYLHAKWHLDPFNRLATIHQRYRQTGQTRTTVP